jgi:aminoglycoside phosphotransferase
LPSPAEIRQAAGDQHAIRRPPPARFPALKLIVKYGSSSAVTIAEGQCLWAIRRLIPTVPVPEVYGWCHDEGQTFIYMELIEGSTLEEAWPDMDIEDRYSICSQLNSVLEDLRSLRQDPAHPFIGMCGLRNLKAHLSHMI